jgi:hypothetical protein
LNTIIKHLRHQFSLDRDNCQIDLLGDVSNRGKDLFALQLAAPRIDREGLDGITKVILGKNDVSRITIIGQRHSDNGHSLWLK